MMTGTFAVVFPGQGSQSLGMLAELAAAQPVVVETFAEASEQLGEDLWALAQGGPEARLNRTDRTQPVMLAAGVAVWRVWREAGGAEPAFMAGHSLGEYTALVCSGVLGFADTVRLVALRGALMQEAVPEGQGGLAAILGLDDETIEAVCADVMAVPGGGLVTPINYNAPGQVVIAGSREAVERAIEAARAAGAKRAVPLALSVPPHCALMRPAAERLAAELGTLHFGAPRVPVIHNLDSTVAAGPEAIRERLIQHLEQPVRWSQGVRLMAERGVTTLIECGPGKVLTGLTRRIDKRLSGVCVQDPDSLAAALAEHGTRA